MALVAVPTDVKCLEVTVQSAAGTPARVQRFDISSTSAITLSMTGLPAGTATISEQAFNVVCSQVQAGTPASWVSSSPLSVTLLSGGTTDAAIVLRKPGNVQITTTFDDGQLSISPLSLDFGSVVVGTTSVNLASSVHNTSPVSVPPPQVSLSGPNADQFLLEDVAPACLGSISLPPNNGACEVIVYFKPTSAGTKTATVNVGGTMVTLTGVGATATPTPVYRINCGSGSAASPFAADQYVSGGTQRTTTNTINTSGVTNAAPQAVYQSERYGNSTYTFPNLTASAKYTVRLHFAELYQTAAGKRVFNVTINGTTVLSNFDIYAVAGGNKAVVREFSTTANSSGQIVVKLVTVTDNATIEGIEILQ